MRRLRLFACVPRFTRAIGLSFAAGQAGSICFTRFTSEAEISVSLRSFRFRFFAFLVRMWLFPLFMRTILPPPVRLKRFAAPRCVFIFGISLLRRGGCARHGTLCRRGGG